MSEQTAENDCGCYTPQEHERLGHAAENGLPTNESIGAHLEQRKASLGWQDCTCPWGWHSLGRLYGANMGKDWARSSTDPACPDHGHDAEARRRAAANLPRIGRTRPIPPGSAEDAP